MVKLSRISSVICFALALYCFVGFFVYLLAQDRIISVFASKAVADAPFMFPVSIFIKVFSLALSGVLLFIVAGKTKAGIWGEIVVASLTSCGTLVIEWFVSLYQNILMGQMGSKVLAAYSALITGYSINSVVSTFTAALIMFTCGLSLTAKVYERRTLKNTL